MPSGSLLCPRSLDSEHDGCSRNTARMQEWMNKQIHVQNYRYLPLQDTSYYKVLKKTIRRNKLRTIAPTSQCWLNVLPGTTEVSYSINHNCSWMPFLTSFLLFPKVKIWVCTMPKPVLTFCCVILDAGASTSFYRK